MKIVLKCCLLLLSLAIAAQCRHLWEIIFHVAGSVFVCVEMKKSFGYKSDRIERQVNATMTELQSQTLNPFHVGYNFYFRTASE